ncbi:MAG: hypothetical protein ACRD32_00585, partial [Nitrososphaerales archaeon]
RYTVQEAQRELKGVGHDVFENVRNHLEAGEWRESVQILLDLDNEVDLIIKEARRLRLQGKLDLEIYSTLINGYSDLRERIFELAGEHGVLKQVRSLYNFNKYAKKVTKDAGCNTLVTLLDNQF